MPLFEEKNLSEHSSCWQLSSCSFRCHVNTQVLLGPRVVNWSWGRHFFPHCPFKTSIKPSLSPTIQRDREAEHVFVRISGGGSKGDKASWNRKCWLGRVPASGNVFSPRGSLKRPQRGFLSSSEAMTHFSSIFRV